MKRIISIVLSIVLVLSLVGCSKLPAIETPKSNGDQSTLTNAGFSSLDNKMIEYFDAEYENQSYMLSPLSLKMAIALTAPGAGSDTLQGILSFMDHSSLESVLAWGDQVMQWERSFDEQNATKLRISNGIWHNQNQPGQFLESYLDLVNVLNANVKNIDGSLMKDDINQWIEDNTNGLIKDLFKESLESHNNILVNALYMKSAWQTCFDEALTKEEDFTLLNGDTIKVQMMHQTDSFDYYKDNACQVLILPLEDGLKAAFVIGDSSDLVEKLDKCERTYVDVKLPKFEIATTASDNLKQFLVDNGMSTAFDPSKADFSNMMDVDLFISSITQSTKIIVEEGGIEAAAVTALTMDTTGFVEKPKPVEFHADETFHFYIYAEDEMLIEPLLLFYGQYNG